MLLQFPLDYLPSAVSVKDVQITVLEDELLHIPLPKSSEVKPAKGRAVFRWTQAFLGGTFGFVALASCPVSSVSIN